MQKIVPNLWCDRNAREVAEFYVSLFPDSKVTGGSTYPESQEDGLADFQLEFAGKDLTIELHLAGSEFTLINAGSEFKPNPSISFMVNFDPARDANAKEKLTALWEKLLDGGEALMPLQEYPFSQLYGWVMDKFGFSWQLILTDSDRSGRPFIMPNLMFGGAAQNRAEEAVGYYSSVFENSEVGDIAKYEQESGPAKPGNIMFADFKLEGQWFAAMDSAVEQSESFNEAISFVVFCKDQKEIDYFWSKLSSVAEAEQCGWCKDKFGVSWQIVPENMQELMERPNAFNILMQQRKIILEEYKEVI